MSIKDQVRSNFWECVGLIVCDWLLSTVNNAGLQCGVQFVEGNNSCVCAKSSYHTVHDRVVRNTKLHSL